MMNKIKEIHTWYIHLIHFILSHDHIIINTGPNPHSLSRLLESHVNRGADEISLQRSDKEEYFVSSIRGDYRTSTPQGNKRCSFSSSPSPSPSLIPNEWMKYSYDGWKDRWWWRLQNVQCMMRLMILINIHTALQFIISSSHPYFCKTISYSVTRRVIFLFSFVILLLVSLLC